MDKMEDLAEEVGLEEAEVRPEEAGTLHPQLHHKGIMEAQARLLGQTVMLAAEAEPVLPDRMETEIQRLQAMVGMEPLVLLVDQA
jgi:hypothetical protein